MTINESYNGFQLEGGVVRTSEYGVRYKIDVFKDEVLLFSEMTFITGTACVMEFGERRSEQVENAIGDRTIGRCKARLQLGFYEAGREYLKEIDSRDIGTNEIEIEDDLIQLNVLKGLLNLRRSNPKEYKYSKMATHGFRELFSITEDKLLFNLSILLEDGLIEESNIAAAGIESGHFYITTDGIRHLQELKKKKYVLDSGDDATDSDQSKNEFEYDIAISFAGEDRKTAVLIANELSKSGIKVFYDEYEKHKLWGTDLYEYLSYVYERAARYCIMIISSHYAQKLWTTHERKSAQARSFREKGDYILPIRMDSTKIPGLLETVGYIEFSQTNVQEISNLVLRKLNY